MTGAISRRTPITLAILTCALLLVPGIHSAHSQTTCGDGKMASNTYIVAGQAIKSNDCRFRLQYNSDGNLVLYWTNVKALWASNTAGTSTNKVRMQSDGNLVVYNAAGTPVWSSGTNGNTGAYLRVQNDGNVVIRKSNGVAIWATNTPQPSNTPPQVSLTNPANGATFATGSNIGLTATASDSGGSITKVEFFANGTLRGTDTSSPYAITWSNVAAGSYSLTARATDNGGATTTSAARNIVVSSGANSPPTVTMTSPANGATFYTPAAVTLTASASDANGSVARVEFFAGTSLIGSDTTAPYSVSWSTSTRGTYVLTARATDNAGAVTSSGGVSVKVGPLTILVNGSNVDPSNSWIQPGTGEYNAITATYGPSPQPWPWTDNGLFEVIPPVGYIGIFQGAQKFADLLAGLPAVDVNIISHSHGGNVVLLSQYYRPFPPIRRLIQLATPVNWDFGNWRLALDYGVAGRCQVSSTADWVQFHGASPTQIIGFYYNIYSSIAGAIQAFEAIRNGDYQASYSWMAQSIFDQFQADAYLDSTRVEDEGPTLILRGLGHSDLHEPSVWTQIGQIYLPCY